MEPITLFLVISLPLLLAGVALLVHRKREKQLLISEKARNRANARMQQRAFADTEPDHNLFFCGNGMSVIETNTFPSVYDNNVIDLIADGYRPPIQYQTVNPIGAGVHLVSGVPLNFSALDEQNIIVIDINNEYLDPTIMWENK